MFLDIFSMIIEEPKEIEIERNINRLRLIFADDLMCERTLNSFLNVLRKDERFNVQSEDQVLVESFEIDLIILLTITVTAFFINFNAMSSK